jgi:hypothetical protein
VKTKEGHITQIKQRAFVGACGDGSFYYFAA